MEWWAVMMGSAAVLCWFWFTREMRKSKRLQSSGIPKGSTGWPFIGETLDFIACGYSSTPVSFMDKRRALSVLSSSI